MEQIDVLAFGAHPDDIELSCGGTIAKLTKEGKRVIATDMTGGELGTRGTLETRIAESKEAAKILNLSDRINLGLPDGNIEVTIENELNVIYLIRKYRPKAVIMHPGFEHHPDHEATHKLVRKAMFKSGLRKIQTYDNGEMQEPWRIRKLYCYLQSYQFPGKADFYINITDTFETKIKSIEAYKSQVFIPGKSDLSGPPTRLWRPEFLNEIEARAIYFGTLIGCRYAEAFQSIEPLGLKSISDLL